jgi:hypothetical protein
MVAAEALEGNIQVLCDIKRLFDSNEASSEVLAGLLKRFPGSPFGTISAKELTTDTPVTPITPAADTSLAPAADTPPVDTEVVVVEAEVEVGVVEADREAVKAEAKAAEWGRVSVLANELCFQILHTIYMGTSNSSTNTLDRAKRLAGSIRSYHNSIEIDNIVSAVLNVFTTLAGRTPRYV